MIRWPWNTECRGCTVLTRVGMAKQTRINQLLDDIKLLDDLAKKGTAYTITLEARNDALRAELAAHQSEVKREFTETTRQEFRRAFVEEED